LFIKPGRFLRKLLLKEQIKELNIGDHAGFFYEHKKQWLDVIVTFISEGLKKKEKVVYIADEHTIEELRQDFLSEGLDLSQAESTGQFIFLKSEETYLRDGYFDPERTVEMLKKFTEDAIKEGYTASRFTGEMTWELKNITVTEKQLEYEAILNKDLFAKYPCLAICQYNMTKFTPDILRRVLHNHPVVIFGDMVMQNFFYIQPHLYFRSDYEKQEFKHLLRNLRITNRAFQQNIRQQNTIQQFFDNALVGIGIITQERRILDVNQTFCDLTGYKKEEIINSKTDIFYRTKNEFERVGQEVKKQLQEKKFANIETQWVKRNGDIIDVRINVKFLHPEDSEPLLIFTVDDITERKTARQAIERERNQLAAIFDSIDQPIYVLDPESFEILYVNRHMKELFGKNLIGGLCYKEFEERSTPCEECPNETILKLKGQPYKWEYYNPLLKKTFEVTSKTIEWTDERVVIFTVAFDITKIKEAEKERQELVKQIIQLQRLEAIGRLAGGIAHDFNNILTAIKGNAQLALMRSIEDNFIKERIEGVLDASERASSLTRQLLAFSRRQILETKVIDLNKLIKDIEKMIRRLIGEDIELEIYSECEKATIKADPTQIEQVLINLIVNARDAMPQGGKLTIETSCVELDEEYVKRHIGVTPGSYVMLAVSDTGAGMTEEVKERCFEPFFTTKEGGTGLGLSTVYGIVKQHGGNIWVYSELGKGTTFKIYFPKTQEPVEDIKKETYVVIPKGNETILLIEDEKKVREITALMLKSLGYNVLEASNGDEAISIAKEYIKPIDLVLSDVVMPGITGFDMVDRIREKHPEIKVLFMSGYTDNVIVHHGILKEGVNFIQKPFSLKAIAEKIRSILDKK